MSRFSVLLRGVLLGSGGRSRCCAAQTPRLSLCPNGQWLRNWLRKGGIPRRVSVQSRPAQPGPAPSDPRFLGVYAKISLQHQRGGAPSQKCGGRSRREKRRDLPGPFRLTLAGGAAGPFGRSRIHGPPAAAAPARGCSDSVSGVGALKKGTRGVWSNPAIRCKTAVETPRAHRAHQPPRRVFSPSSPLFFHSEITKYALRPF